MLFAKWGGCIDICTVHFSDCNYRFQHFFQTRVAHWTSAHTCWRRAFCAELDDVAADAFMVLCKSTFKLRHLCREPGHAWGLVWMTNHGKPLSTLDADWTYGSGSSNIALDHMWYNQSTASLMVMWLVGEVQYSASATLARAGEANMETPSISKGKLWCSYFEGKWIPLCCLCEKFQHTTASKTTPQCPAGWKGLSHVLCSALLHLLAKIFGLVYMEASQLSGTD